MNLNENFGSRHGGVVRVRTRLPVVPHQGDAGVPARVALLLDTRGERDRDYASAEAITIVGRGRVLRAGSAAWRDAGAAIHAKHPALAAFLAAATTALVRVEIEDAVHVGGFQRVTTWRPAT